MIALGRLYHSRPADKLAGNQERQERHAQVFEHHVPANEVILVAAKGVPGGIDVVLKKVDRALVSFFGQSVFCLQGQPVHHAVTGAFMGDELAEAIAFGGGYLRVRADVEVQAAGIDGKDIGRGVLFHDRPKEHARNLIRT